MARILILGTADDPHVSKVQSALGARSDVEVTLLDYKTSDRTCYTLNESGEALLLIGDEPVDADTVVWNRVKIVEHTPLFPDLDPKVAKTVVDEWRAYYSLIMGEWASRVVNRPVAPWEFLKPIQMRVAASLGLLVPSSAIGTSKARITSSLQGELLALKSLSELSAYINESIPYPSAIPTMRMDCEKLKGVREEQIRICPHFFQTYVEKECELRVHLVNGNIHAFRIDSQSHKLSEIDWRLGTDIIEFHPMQLDTALGERLRNFLDHFSFAYGAFDLIVDREDRIWFLECNPHGQWSWLDDLVDGAIAEDYAKLLRRRAIEVAG